jgi:hypothetical protein
MSIAAQAQPWRRYRLCCRPAASGGLNGRVRLATVQSGSAASGTSCGYVGGMLCRVLTGHLRGDLQLHSDCRAVMTPS